MSKIKNQIRSLYTSSILGNLSLTGTWVAILADDALQVRTNTRLQRMFPSEQRATLISMECFIFSIIMIVLSPLAGFFFSVRSSPETSHYSLIYRISQSPSSVNLSIS